MLLSEMMTGGRTRIRGVRYYVLRLCRFLRIDMWRLTPEETPKSLRLLVGIIKVIYQTTLSFIDDHLTSKASSLTYSTVLSIVPMLAVIVGIAKGFGLQTVVRHSLDEALPGQREQLDLVFEYVENYLSQVQGGLFIGLGLGILLYTVIVLIASIEDTFNEIWQAPHGRPWDRRILNYLGLFILLPFVLTTSSLIPLLASVVRSTILSDVEILHTLLDGAVMFIPLFLSIFIFVGLYMYLPNVRVKFVPALISGILAGIAYQIFQTMYINGVIWISRYNAIYGSFAAFPLLLLWLQLSWTITLYGAQLSYAIQNISSYAFGKASLYATRRYQDFICILILRQMLLRMRSLHRAYTIEEMSRECKIPLSMASTLFARLTSIGLLVEVQYPDADGEAYYQPAISSECLTVDYVVSLLDGSGTEDFRVDKQHQYKHIWNAMLTSRGVAVEGISSGTLIRDL